MTLTGRLTSFFLGLLACLLVGFDVGLYIVADRYLNDQANERLDSALHVLAAAADVNPEGVEWEPESRSLRLGKNDSSDQVRWLVEDDHGREIDRSRNLSADEAADFAKLARGFERQPDLDGEQTVDGRPWRVLHSQIAYRGPASPKASEPGANLYRSLSLTVGGSVAEVKATLWRLAVALGAISIAVWAIAAFGGRWLCRRALTPVTRMAIAARDMTADDWHARMPVSASGDELEDLARAFNGLLDRLEVSFERQRRFTGDASHQLRTPLAAMLGQLEVALLRDRSPDEYWATLEAVRTQSNRLRQIVESQLFLARADAEALNPQLDDVDMVAWLREHLDNWREHRRWSDFHIEAPDHETMSVRTHSQLLAQLVDNLIDNAAKYSPPGTPIKIRLKAANRCVEFIVEDRGSGIAAEDLPHVFEPFFRAGDARRKGIAGAGLGLAVAQRIAQAMRAEIDAGNSPSGGAQFSVRLVKAAVVPGDAVSTGVPDSAIPSLYPRQ